MIPDRHQQALAAALCILAAPALILASRRPAWRPFAHQLAALACIDLARLWVSPLAQARAQPWWSLDVALMALWPVVLAWGLSPTFGGAFVGRPFEEGGAPESEPPSPTHHRVAGKKRLLCAVRGDFHAPTLPRLLVLAAFALALGAARPWLPRLAYLCALRVPRWALAALWVEALVRLKNGAGSVRSPTSSRVYGRSCHPSQRAVEPDVSGVSRACEATSELPAHAHHAHGARLAQVCALILAGTNAADLLAGAWLVPPWEAPAWGYARAVTWAAYGAVACVMGWAWRRG